MRCILCMIVGILICLSEALPVKAADEEADVSERMERSLASLVEENEDCAQSPAYEKYQNCISSKKNPDEYADCIDKDNWQVAKGCL